MIVLNLPKILQLYSCFLHFCIDSFTNLSSTFHLITSELYFTKVMKQMENTIEFH